MEAVNVDPFGTLAMLNEPLASAAAPLLVPSTTTFAPARASPVEASVTVPDTVICATEYVVREKKRIPKRIRM